MLQEHDAVACQRVAGAVGPDGGGAGNQHEYLFGGVRGAGQALLCGQADVVEAEVTGALGGGNDLAPVARLADGRATLGQV